ncbi:GIY-YIG nuclease family protein [Vibrio owensii]|uniref:GIY-YIG nuclease family protein n=1 Tax=Vibrio owensii TaxID=696485 RepID=UPI0037481DFC
MSLVTKKYKGSKIAQVKESGGIYAWYYRPSIPSYEKLANTVDQIVQSSCLSISTQISGRYGAKHLSDSQALLTFGYKELSPREIVDNCIRDGGDELLSFLQDEDVILFSRPLYIGISKNLYSRTFEQHYRKLQSYWEEDSSVSKFLRIKPDASVQDLINELDEKHSFALEARVKRVPPRDLLLVVNYRDELAEQTTKMSSERKVEQLLHLMTDPVLGRR